MVLRYFYLCRSLRRIAEIISLLIIFSFTSNNVFAQNIAINSTGAAAGANNMLEVTQSNAAANMVALYAINNAATAGTGYGFQALKTGAGTTNIAGYFSASGGTNNYAIIVPSTGGNVGIGTTSPLQKLHILDGSAFIENSNTFENTLLNGGGMEIYRSQSASVPTVNGFIDFKDNTADDYDFRIDYNHSYGANGGFEFVSTTNGQFGTLATRMTILNSNGNVGIGTTAPSGLLHLNATGQSTFLMSDKTTAGNQLGRIVYDGGSIVTGGGWVFQKMTDAGAFTANLFSIIQNSGNVGINTITPLSKLDVAGGVSIGTYGGANAAPSNGLIVSGFFGVGTNNPLRPIHLYSSTANNDGRIRITATSTTAGQESGLEFYGNGGNANTFGGGILRDQNTNAVSIYTGSGGTIKMLTVLDGGNVGIGTAAPGTYKLAVNGQPAANGYTAFTNYSDARLKENVIEIGSSLDKILKLRPVQFNYNEEYLNLYNDSSALTRLQKGFIAQEVKALFPEMVGISIVKGKEYYDLNLSNLQIYLVKAMQEQQKLIDELNKKVNDLEKRLNTSGNPPILKK